MRAALFLLASLIALPVAAQVRPVPGAGDPRLQTVVYDAEQVVLLPVSSGYQLMVSFAPGEHIETIAAGDSGPWEITANKRGDYLFIRNLMPAASTNMTVVTDARVYNFELMSVSVYGEEAPFMVRFVYPDPPDPAKARIEMTPGYRYALSGARQIRPETIVQQEDKLLLGWAKEAPLPAVFRIEEDGVETLVNSEMQEDYFVIHGFPKKLVFRLDKLTATATRKSVRGK